MTNETLEQQEVTANPYNERKPWQEENAPQEVSSADTLFYADEQPSRPKATRKKATPEKKEADASTNYKKRYDDLKKHYDEKIAEFKQKEQELQAKARSAEPQYMPPKSPEELENFRQQYPDLFETVETVAHMRSQEEINAVQQKLKAIEEREAMIAKREAETKLRERHPDFEDIRGDEGFHEWAKEQPEEIQNWIYKNPDNVNLASRAIDFYKMEKGIAIGGTKKRKSQTTSKNAADFVSTKTTGVDAKEPKFWTQREIAALSIDEFEKYESDIDLAIQEGRVR